MPEEMRMHCSAPSFSLRLGKTLSVWSKDELKSGKASISGNIIALYPGINMLSDPQSWAKLLSDAYFVVILFPFDYKPVSQLTKALERAIYSPLLEHLEGVAIAKSEEEAVSLIKTIKEETQREVVTINNTEEE